MTNTDQPATEWVLAPNANLEAMSRLGLGGSASVHGLFFAGAMAIDMGKLARVAEAETIADETRYCVGQLRDRLAAVGCVLGDIAKLTCYVDEVEFIEEMWRTLDEEFAPGPYPKRITLVSGVGVDCRVEFEAVVARPEVEDK